MKAVKTHTKEVVRKENTRKSETNRDISKTSQENRKFWGNN